MYSLYLLRYQYSQMVWDGYQSINTWNLEGLTYDHLNGYLNLNHHSCMTAVYDGLVGVVIFLVIKCHKNSHFY